MIKVFIGGECSGRVRQALVRRGAWVVSCDLKPAEDGVGKPTSYASGHWIGDMCDVVDYLYEMQLEFDVGLWHPECIYLTNSAAWAYGDGPYHQRVKPGTLTGQARRAAREEQLRYVERIGRLPIPRKILENPAQGALSARIGAPSQVVQPYMFGDDASKATGLWLHQVRPLEIPPIAQWAPPRLVGGRPRWSNQTDSGQNRLSPGEHRAADRSRTYPGIAEALADAIMRSCGAA